MDENQWLSSKDPQAMLKYLLAVTDSVYGYSPEYGRKPSDRKLRLFACACRRIVGGYKWDSENGWDKLEEDGQGADDYPAARTAGLFLRGNEGHWSRFAGAMRDIIGNPFRSVTIKTEWLTRDVRAMAEVAYLERPGRLCGRCWQGKVSDHEAIDLYHSCPDCHGSGRIEDGQLDPVRLAILADSLEEAGCDNREVLGQLRGWTRCPCNGRDFSRVEMQTTAAAMDFSGVKVVCGSCGGSGIIRLPEQKHYRGMWSLDLIRGAK